MLKVKYSIFDRPSDLSLGPVQKEQVRLWIVDDDGNEIDFPQNGLAHLGFYHSYFKQNVTRSEPSPFTGVAWMLLLLRVVGVELIKADDSQYDSYLIKKYEKNLARPAEDPKQLLLPFEEEI
jgi:hypothetical protein